MRVKPGCCKEHRDGRGRRENTGCKGEPSSPVGQSPLGEGSRQLRFDGPIEPIGIASDGFKTNQQRTGDKADEESRHERPNPHSLGSAVDVSRC